VQKFIKGVASTVKNKGVSTEKLINQEYELKKMKKKEEEEQALLASL